MKKFVLALFVLSLVSFNVQPIEQSAGDNPEVKKPECTAGTQANRSNKPVVDEVVKAHSDTKAPAKVLKGI